MRRCSAGEVWEMEKKGSAPSRSQFSAAPSVPGHVAKQRVGLVLRVVSSTAFCSLVKNF